MDLQAMARVWCDGQRKPCTVYRLLTTGGCLGLGAWAGQRWPGADGWSGPWPVALPAAAAGGGVQRPSTPVRHLRASMHPPTHPSTLPHAGTLDEKMYQRQMKKGELAAAMMAGQGGAGAAGAGSSKFRWAIGGWLVRLLAVGGCW